MNGQALQLQDLMKFFHLERNPARAQTTAARHPVGSRKHRGATPEEGLPARHAFGPALQTAAADFERF